MAFFLFRLSKEEREEILGSLDLNNIAASSFSPPKGEPWPGQNSSSYAANDKKSHQDSNKKKAEYKQILKNLSLPSLRYSRFDSRYKDLEAFASLFSQSSDPFVVIEAVIESEAFSKSLGVFLKSIMPLSLWEKFFCIIWRGWVRSGNVCRGEVHAFCNRTNIAIEDLTSAIRRDGLLKLLFPIMFRE